MGRVKCKRERAFWFKVNQLQRQLFCNVFAVWMCVCLCPHSGWKYSRGVYLNVSLWFLHPLRLPRLGPLPGPSDVIHSLFCFPLLKPCSHFGLALLISLTFLLSVLGYW